MDSNVKLLARRDLANLREVISVCDRQAWIEIRRQLLKLVKSLDEKHEVRREKNGRQVHDRL